MDTAEKTLDYLMNQLSDKDGMNRQSARESLVDMGKVAVMPLADALRTSPSDQVRWEAAKALGAMGDARSIGALIQALGDRDSDVVWLAGEALKSFGRTAWPLILTELINEGTQSPVLRKGAHHVFSSQKDEKFQDLLDPLLEALDLGALSGAASIAAHDIMNRMRDS